MTNTPLTILFESDRLIAIDKPPGLPSHATVDPKRADAFRALRAQLTARDGAPPALALLHRLDRDTSGVLLFSKNADFHDEAAAFFRQRTIEKTYLAATQRRPSQDEWIVESYLAEEKTTASKVPRTVSVRSGGQIARTEFRVVRSKPKFYWIEARPSTGRRHQIRAHLAESGVPLIGDSLYGGPPLGRVRLHAWKLAWTQDGHRMEISAPIPADFEPSSTTSKEKSNVNKKR